MTEVTPIVAQEAGYRVEDSLVFCCPKCKRVFSDASELRRHVEIIESVSSTSTSAGETE